MKQRLRGEDEMARTRYSQVGTEQRHIGEAEALGEITIESYTSARAGKYTYCVAGSLHP